MLKKMSPKMASRFIIIKRPTLPFSGTLCMSIEEVNQQKCISHYVININRNGITSTVVLSGHGWVIVHWWGLLVIL